MDARIVAEFGMESGGHHLALAYDDGIVALGGKDFDVGTDALDPGGADENHFRGLAVELPFPDGTVELAAVGVAADADVEHAQTFLFRILDFARQEDCTRTGAKSWLEVDELLEFLKSLFAEEFQESGRLAAGDDEAVDLVELFGFADEGDVGAEFLEPFAMRVKVALQGKNTDGHFTTQLSLFRVRRRSRFEARRVTFDISTEPDTQVCHSSVH